MNHKVAPEGDGVLPYVTRAKSNAREIISIIKTSVMEDAIEGAQGEPEDTDVHDDTCSAESNLLEVRSDHSNQ